MPSTPSEERRVSRVESIYDLLGDIQQTVRGHDDRLDRTDGRLAGHDQRFDTIDATLAEVLRRLPEAS